MQSDREIRNARMVQAYRHAQNGNGVMARIYASSAAAVHPLTGGQKRRLERFINRRKERGDDTDLLDMCGSGVLSGSAGDDDSGHGVP